MKNDKKIIINERVNKMGLYKTLHHVLKALSACTYTYTSSSTKLLAKFVQSLRYNDSEDSYCGIVCYYTA
jgi:hypothetical protein